MTDKKNNGADFIPDEDETVKQIRENRDRKQSISDDESIEWFEAGKTVWKILE